LIIKNRKYGNGLCDIDERTLTRMMLNYDIGEESILVNKEPKSVYIKTPKLILFDFDDYNDDKTMKRNEFKSNMQLVNIEDSTKVLCDEKNSLK